MKMGYERLLGQRLVGLVRRSVPGVHAAVNLVNFDRTIAVVFHFGGRYHGVRINRGARRLPPHITRAVVHKLYPSRVTARRKSDSRQGVAQKARRNLEGLMATTKKKSTTLKRSGTSRASTTKRRTTSRSGSRTTSKR